MELENFSNKDVNPHILIDKESYHLKISGISYPEDAVLIYTPVLDWLDALDKQFEKELTCEFHFEFLNSVSNKMVYEILYKLREFRANGRQVAILWHYNEDDEDVLELGQDLSKLLKLNVQFVAVPEEDN